MDPVYPGPLPAAFRASKSSLMYSCTTAQICRSDENGQLVMEDVAIDGWDGLITKHISGTCIIFLPTEEFKPARRENESHYSSRREALRMKFGLPATFWTHTSQKASGYFGCEDHYDEDGNVIGHNTWLHFLIKQACPSLGKNWSYSWQMIKIFTQWRKGQGSVILCFDPPPAFRQGLQDLVCKLAAEEKEESSCPDPYYVHTVLIEGVIALFNRSVWSFRDLVRHAEENRDWSDYSQPPFPELHDVLRHVIHSSETLDIGGSVLQSIISHHASFVQDNTDKSHAKICTKVRHTLGYQQTLFRCLKLRSDALDARLRNEINLAFNTVSHNNSRAAFIISQAAQSDSRSMRTIAILTLVFLPGTFISTIMAMPFFTVSRDPSTGGDTLVMASSFWIYWAITAPITLVTVLCWVIWQFWETKLFRRLNFAGGLSGGGLVKVP